MILLVLYLCLQTLTLASSDRYHNPHFASYRSGIVHLFEWKWTDIARECEEYLAPKGFGGVQVSPVQENVVIKGRPWYERYQPQSYNISTRSGNEKEFLDMTKRCNAVGVRIYVDIVFNHMAKTEGVGTGGSLSNVSMLDFPGVPYKSQHFHEACDIVSHRNATELRNCRLEGLPDLDQSQEYVRRKIVDLMNKLIDLGVAGFRVDAAKHMWPSDLANIYGRLNYLNTSFGFPVYAKPFIVQEFIEMELDTVKKYEYNYIAPVTEYRSSFMLGVCFRGLYPLGNLIEWGEAWGFVPSKDALVFVDNHYNQRGYGYGEGDKILTYKNSKEYKMAIAFMLAHPYGIPRIMSSFAFNDINQGPPMYANETIISPEFNSSTGLCLNDAWICEHRWPEIQSMIKFKNTVGNASLVHWWSKYKQIAFGREGYGFVAFNGETKEKLTQKLFTGLPAGTYCDIISGTKTPGLRQCTGKKIVVNLEGKATIHIPSDDPYGFIAVIKSAAQLTQMNAILLTILGVFAMITNF